MTSRLDSLFSTLEFRDNTDTYKGDFAFRSFVSYYNNTTNDSARTNSIVKDADFIINVNNFLCKIVDISLFVETVKVDIDDRYSSLLRSKVKSTIHNYIPTIIAAFDTVNSNLMLLELTNNPEDRSLIPGPTTYTIKSLYVDYQSYMKTLSSFGWITVGEEEYVSSLEILFEISDEKRNILDQKIDFKAKYKVRDL